MNIFKNIFLVLILAIFCSHKIAAQEPVNEKTYNLSYAYGAQMAMGLERMGFTAEETNADKFVEGFKAGLTVDSAAYATARQMLVDRMGNEQPSSTPEQAQQLAYSMGLSSIGGLTLEVAVAATDFDLEALKEGFSKSIAKDSLMLSQTQMDSILKDYFNPKSDEYHAKMEAKQKLLASKTLEESEKFLAENKTRKGVVTTKSGLQYEIIKKGKGKKKPTLEDQVKTHYHGTLIDGTIFDSSVDRNEPVTFPLNAVIEGWQEGVSLMAVGAKYRFFIPQNLAYGMQSPSPSIPAGATLIFEVELLEINPKEETK